MATLEQATAASQTLLHSLEGQAAVGIAPTDDGYAVAVRVQQELPPGLQIPDRIDDVPVQVEFIGQGFPQPLGISDPEA